MNAAILPRLFPLLQWLPAVTRASLRPDLEAGFIGAILILPQAIALATLAGMPPEYGIYTSIFPVIIAALWGSSWHTLSGPNTAVCVLIASSVAPFAAFGTDHYIGYVLALTLMAGVVQVVLGTLRLGSALDFISLTVVSGIVLAVALIIIVFAASAFLGVLANLDEPFLVRLYQVAHDIPRANPYAVAVGGLTVVSGLVARRWYRRYSLVIAVAIGSVFGYLLNLVLGPANTNLELLGRLSLAALPFSLPSFNLESMAVLKELVTSSFAIAFLGLMQTLVIARSLAAKSGQHIDTNQEIVSQGLSNMAAPFLSSFAGSGSFNRSAAHYDAGAKTPMAAVYASVMLALMVLVGSGLITHIPMAAVAGALVLVGYGLIDVGEIRRVLHSRQESVIFFLTFAAALGLGLNSGVFVGVLLSLAIYLWYASTPNIVTQQNTTRDGRRATVVNVDGNLFFGSVRHVEREFTRIGEVDQHKDLLLVRTDHMTYMDVPGAALITAEARRRRKAGGDLYVFVTREPILEAIRRAGFFDACGADHVIERNRDHPMKDVLYPSRVTARAATASTEPAAAGNSETLADKKIPTGKLAERLARTKLFSMLDADQLETLLSGCSVQIAAPDEIIIDPKRPMRDHFVLLEGSVKIARYWTQPDGTERFSTRTMQPMPTDPTPVLTAAGHGIHITAASACRYLMVSGPDMDDMLGWNQQLSHTAETDAELHKRLGLLRRVSVFHRLPLENVEAAARRMTVREAQGGETVLRQGEPGHSYFILVSGEAGIWKQDSFSDETVYAAQHAPVARLGPGDGFGEEALLQESPCGATVMMTAPGRLLVLEKKDFDELVKPTFMHTIAAKDAVALAKKKKRVEWIDCRYDLEYSESRLPGSRHIPLDQLREHVHDLDPDSVYIVYSRSDRRSRAAAFLLAERGLEVHVLAGGLLDWPFELDTTPLTGN